MKPRNAREVPIGSVSVHRRKGRSPRVMVKLNNDGQPRWKRWARLSRVVWEAAHGSLPPGYIIIFRNGNALDCRLENLHAITHEESLRRNVEASMDKCGKVRAAMCRELGKRYWRMGVQARRIANFKRAHQHAG